jgi:hypothetical protein
VEAPGDAVTRELTSGLSGELHRVGSVAEGRKEQLGHSSPRRSMVVTTVS